MLGVTFSIKITFAIIHIFSICRGFGMNPPQIWGSYCNNIFSKPAIVFQAHSVSEMLGVGKVT